MRNCLSLLLITICPALSPFVSGQEEPSAKTDSPWISLFNGKNLKGWTPKIRGHQLGDNFGNTFRVEDGKIQVGFEKYGEFKERFGHLFYDEKFSNYIFRCEYRFIGKQCPGGPGWARRNSGIMLHCQDPKSMTLDQDFPVSIEVQLLGGFGSGKRTTANLCTPGTNVVMNNRLITSHCNSSSSKTYHGEQWVTVEVEVRGGELIKHRIDGKVVLQYDKPQLDPRDGMAKKLIRDGNLILSEGYISLQAESHPCEFRNVQLKKLD
ncbi:MAG: DUF1080 domain-containing protein [Planctomycetota bacterium]|nr:DUF1080 domain-containing protein [Planctomycetota bacterium]